MDTSNMTTQEIREANSAAREALYDKNKEREKFITDRKGRADERIRKAARRVYGEVLTTLNEAARVTGDALRQRIDEEALAGVGAKYPVGTKLIEWAFPSIRRGWGRSGQAQMDSTVPSGRTGVYTAVTSTTQFPDNIKHGLPKPGQFVVFIHNKGGELGKKFETLRTNIFVPSDIKTGWYPEGVNPNESVPVINVPTPA